MLNYTSTRKKTVDYINSMSSTGGASLHVYKVKGTAEGNNIYFL